MSIDHLQVATSWIFLLQAHLWVKSGQAAYSPMYVPLNEYDGIRFMVTCVHGWKAFEFYTIGYLRNVNEGHPLHAS